CVIVFRYLDRLPLGGPTFVDVKPPVLAVSSEGAVLDEGHVGLDRMLSALRIGQTRPAVPLFQCPRSLQPIQIAGGRYRHHRRNHWRTRTNTGGRRTWRREIECGNRTDGARRK